MKKWVLIAALLATSALPASAQIKVSDNLTLKGFLDMSTYYDNKTKTNTLSFDQFEVDFFYDYGHGISARADINSLGGGAVTFEQGFVTYTTPKGVSISAGKFLSCSGWEAAEPTDMYQYSYSETLVYGGYQNGVNISYKAPKFGLYGALVSSVWNGSDTNLDKPGFEGQVSLMPAPGVTSKIAYLWEDMGAYKQSLINAWASYVKGPATLAGEYNYLHNWGAASNNGNGWLLMANVALAPKVAATVRYSGLDTDNTSKVTEITFSPSYKIADNWGILAELRRDIDTKVTSFAVETTFTF